MIVVVHKSCLSWRTDNRVHDRMKGLIRLMVIAYRYQLDGIGCSEELLRVVTSVCLETLDQVVDV